MRSSPPHVSSHKTHPTEDEEGNKEHNSLLVLIRTCTASSCRNLADTCFKR